MAKNVGLRTEIIVNLSLLLGAALLFAGFLLLKLTERELVAQRVEAVVGTMEIVASALTAGQAGVLPSPEAFSIRAQTLLRALPASLVIEAWELVDSELVTLAAMMPAGSKRLSALDLKRMRLTAEPSVRIQYSSAWLDAGESNPGFVLVTVPVAQRGQFLGAMQARFSLAEVRERIAGARKLVLVYVVLYGAVLIGFGLYLLGRNVVRPIRRLMEMTRTVAAGELGRSLPVEGPREIAELAGSFNAMVAALKESRAETEATIRSLRQTNQDLSRTRDELVRSEKMASVGHLAAGMAHEIGNPLGAVVGYLGLLRAELPEGTEREIAERTLAETERIDRLVRDLLDFAAPGKSEPEEVDSAAVLAEAVDMLTHQGAFKGLLVENRLPPGLPATLIARHKLLQVFVNLMINARDASSAGGTLWFEGGSDDRWVRISLGDEGEGMSPEVAAHIFDPFYTTKAPGKGRGLGLAVCHRVIEEAGGRIEVSSEPGKGSVFMICLKKAEAFGDEA